MGVDTSFEMSASTSVQRAHDELLRVKPESHAHDCSLCHRGADNPTEKAEEGVQVAATDDKVFTEAQHHTLVETAVERETASLTAKTTELEATVASLQTEKASLEESLETAKADLQNKIDVLEGEKASEGARADVAEKAFEDFKAELAELTAVEERKSARVEAIKAADATLADEYFTDARVQRWAEMADEHFDSLVTDLVEAAAKKKPAPSDDDADDKETATEQARETAAFNGGVSPTAGKGSALSGFLTATGFLPKNHS